MFHCIGMDIEKEIAKIAEKHLFIETLEERKSDSLDFSEVSVWGVKAALEEAFKLGQENAQKGAKS